MKIKLLDYRELKDFSPGSGLEWYNEQLYLIGDDATDLLVLDKRWKPRDIIPLFHNKEEQIATGNSPHVHHKATTIVHIKKAPYLLVTGPGSGETYHSSTLLMDLQTKATEEYDLQLFYNRAKASGLPQLNIQAAAAVNEYIILGDRSNHLLITSNEYWKDPQQAELLILPLELSLKKDQGAGITGLAYSEFHDCLLFTVVAEAGGESYLGLIENAARKIGRKKMKVNDLVSLPEADKTFKGHSMQAVCIQSEKKSSMKLHLAADDDHGGSYLFKIGVKL